MVWYVLKQLQELIMTDEVIVGILTGQLQIFCRY